MDKNEPKMAYAFWTAAQYLSHQQLPTLSIFVTVHGKSGGMQPFRTMWNDRNPAWHKNNYNSIGLGVQALTARLTDFLWSAHKKHLPRIVICPIFHFKITMFLKFSWTTHLQKLEQPSPGISDGCTRTPPPSTCDISKSREFCPLSNHTASTMYAQSVWPILGMMGISQASKVENPACLPQVQIHVVH